MNNYEYIIAGLPLVSSDDRSCPPAEEVLEEIRSQLSESDNALLSKLLRGYDPDSLTADFYSAMLREHNSFLRGFFRFDLCLRNVKTDWLNSALGRPEGSDCVRLPEMEDYDFDSRSAAEEVLSGTDIIKRERGLDDLLWAEIDRLTEMEVFSINVILAFVAKLKIVDRWSRLDPETGAAYFRTLVREIRQTYDNKKQSIS